MKKTVKFLGMACMLGAFAFLCSCNKDKTKVSSVNVILPTVEESYVEGDRAYIDYSDGNKMKWNEGDEIMMYNLAEDYTQSQAEVYSLLTGAGTTTATFKGNELNGTTEVGYYAFYPASKVKNHPLGVNNSQTFDVPAEQTYNANTMDPTSLVMAFSGENVPSGNFSMHHIYGFANIRMKGSSNRVVKSVKIIDNAFNLNGNVTADIPGINDQTLEGLINQCADSQVPFETYMGALKDYLDEINYSSEPGDKTMTLNCPEGVQLNPNTYTKFIITLRPGALVKGFKVEITFADGETVTVNKFNPKSPDYCVANNPIYPRAFCVKPGGLLNFNVTGL